MPIPLLAGMLYAAAGYKNHQAGERARERQEKADARQDVVNSQSDAKHEALMAEEARRVKEAQRLIDNRESDAKAFAPVAAQDVATEYAGPNANSPGVVDDPLMQGLIEKQTAKRNTMDSRTQRLADNQAATGRVADSMATMGTQVGRTRNDTAYQQQQDAIAKKVKEEGLIETAQAARTGDAQAVFERFNSGGAMKLDAVPTVQAVKRKINGLGEITDYIYSGTTTGPDGKKVPFQKSAFDISMQVMPFEKQLGTMQKGEEIANRGALQAAQADAATMRAMLAQNRGGGGSAAAPAQTPTGFNMDALDKQLMPWFTTKDEATGKTAVNTVALNDLRQLALRTPAAQSGDVNGAAFQVKNLYDIYMAKTGNDHNKAMALLQQDSAPKQPVESKPSAAPVAAPAPKAAPAPEKKPVAATNGSNIIRDNPSAVATIKPLIEAQAVEMERMKSVARSGDPMAAQVQAQKLQAATAALQKAAKTQFGGAADEVLNAISATR